ncbi:MAG: beta-glucosidase BglX [Bacteroidota bacterium]
MKKTIGLVVLCSISMVQGQHKKSMNTNATIDQKVEALLQKMTLEEKIGQMNQYNGFWEVTGPAPQSGDAQRKYEHLKKGWVGSMLTVRGTKEVRAVQKIAVEETRLGIPLIIGFDVIHGYKTISPIPLAEAASWDIEAIKRSAQMAADEASASGINWTFGPNVDIVRDARWGRVMEGAGEDPFLGSCVATARVKGFQGESKADLANVNTLAACAKHFAGYGFVEAGKEYNTVDMGNATLFNTVLPPFEAAQKAGVRTFMNAFNILNGVPATGSSFLQRTLLKGKWGFDGFVVTDWASIREMINHGFAHDGAEASQKAITAGADMDMESHLYIKELVGLVNQGKVSETLVDDAVRRILRVKFELGLFDDPYRYCDPKREKETVGSAKQKAIALEMAKKSIVLLKNDHQLLPLPQSGKKIALIGALAADTNSPLGSWRIAADDHTAVSVVEGMQRYKGNTLEYAKGADLTLGKTTFVDELVFNTTDTSGFAEAIQVAQRADVVVMVLGEHGFQSGEGRSRTQLDLPGVQQALLEAVYAVNPNIVLVLQNGRPLALPWAAEHIPAIVEAWHLGTTSGDAIAAVLYGDYNPSGKLPMTFPRNVGQCPIYYNHHNTGRPTNSDNNVFWSHYSDVEKTPQWPFGHGLSYTQFSYLKPQMKKNVFVQGEPIEVDVTVTNTGSRTGVEVVQMYIQDIAASLSRPVKELKGFERIELQPGASKTVTFKLTDSSLGFYDNEGVYRVESGFFNVFIGTNSQEVQSLQFEIR